MRKLKFAGSCPFKCCVCLLICAVRGTSRCVQIKKNTKKKTNRAASESIPLLKTLQRGGLFSRLVPLYGAASVCVLLHVPATGCVRSPVCADLFACALISQCFIINSFRHLLLAPVVVRASLVKPGVFFHKENVLRHSKLT